MKTEKEKAVTLIAIMQGRLLPPEDGRFQSFPSAHWREEFPAAARAGLEAIEWIYERYGEELNPIASDEGLAGIQSLSAAHNVAVLSLCADYFMDYPIVTASADERSALKKKLLWLLARCRQAGIARMVLPFVDRSRMRDGTDLQNVVGFLNEVLPHAEENRVELHLETDLPPDAFAGLLDRIPHDWLKANYDSGNSSSLGYRPQDEFAAYGHRIGSVHIKDRLLGGATVPLGTGDADLPAVVDCLAALRYRGDFVLQVARGQEGGEVAWARENRDHLCGLLEKASFAASGENP